MYRRCSGLSLALSLVLSCAPLCSDVRAQQAQSTDNAKTQVQTGTKQNAQAGQKPTPTDKQVEKVKRTVSKVGVAQKITIFLKNGDTLHGTVAQIGEDSFQISEVDMRQTLAVQYVEVKKVRSGYGGINLFTGKRASPPRGTRIALFSALAVVLALPIIVLATSKD
jgi:sRNA-binding regulator protein Hfq